LLTKLVSPFFSKTDRRSTEANHTLSVQIFTDRLPTKNENLMEDYETSPESTYFQKTLTPVQGTRLILENLILTNLVPIISINTLLTALVSFSSKYPAITLYYADLL
ncbi:MAG: hypothetical protein U9P36_01910, partial [Thermodesulfobacteriota bacterium]|nr:hypothetical protein [Thermodesulfobacteriota bacterium]